MTCPVRLSFLIILCWLYHSMTDSDSVLCVRCTHIVHEQCAPIAPHSQNATVNYSGDALFWQNTHPAHSCAKLLLIYKTGFNTTCFFSLLSTIERLHGIETGIVMSRYLAVSWHHNISWYIETSLILVSKRRYSRYLSRYQRYRTALVYRSYVKNVKRQFFNTQWILRCS